MCFEESIDGRGQKFEASTQAKTDAHTAVYHRITKLLGNYVDSMQDRSNKVVEFATPTEILSIFSRCVPLSQDGQLECREVGNYPRMQPHNHVNADGESLTLPLLGIRQRLRIIRGRWRRCDARRDSPPHRACPRLLGPHLIPSLFQPALREGGPYRPRCRKRHCNPQHQRIYVGGEDSPRPSRQGDRRSQASIEMHPIFTCCGRILIPLLPHPDPLSPGCPRLHNTRTLPRQEAGSRLRHAMW